MIKVSTSLLAAALMCMPAIPTFAQITQFKIIDDGGSGPYPAIAATEESLSDYVVYRPRDLATAAHQGTLPVLVFGNGACVDNSSEYERTLTEIASQGYVIVAIGALQLGGERETKNTAASMLIDALNWLGKRASQTGNDYYHNINLKKVGVMGHSCGGAQTLSVSNDPRVSTSILFNAGMGDMNMAGANSDSLKQLHAPLLYIIGGPLDIAHANAVLDYERIQTLPVAFADLAEGGHSGTFAEPNGGSFSKVSLAWLDWQLKNQHQYAPLFLNGELPHIFNGWSVKAKNFN